MRPRRMVVWSSVAVATALAPLQAQWQRIMTADVPALNAQLKQAGLAEIVLK